MTDNTITPPAPRAGLNWSGIGGWTVALILLALLPQIFSGNAAVSTLNYLGTMAIFALSYNVLLGQTGLLSLGHGTFFGLGGFMATHAVLAMADAGWNFPLALVPAIGGLGAFIAGIFGGWLSSSRGGMPFAMITLGLAELVYAAAALFPSIYGSEEGVGMDRMDLGPSLGMDYAANSDIYMIVLGWLLITMACLWGLTRTPLGLLTNAVRDNAERVEFVGFSARRVRLSAYAIAAGFAGVAGSLAALNFEIMTVHELGAGTSTLVLLMTYIGGTRHFLGPVLGAVVIGLMKVWLSDISPAWMMYFGLLFVFVVMVAQGGLAGILAGGWAILRSGTAKEQAPTLGLLCLAGLATTLGGIILIELGYRAGLEAGLGPDMHVFGLPLSTASLFSWLFGAALLLGGAFTIRPLLDRLASLRHALAASQTGETA